MRPTSSSRLYAPPNGDFFVLVSSSSSPSLLISRTDGSLSLLEASGLDARIGSPTHRCPSCSLLSLVGIVSFADERSLILVTDAVEREILGPAGLCKAFAVLRVGFLSLAKRNVGVAGVDNEGTKARLQLKELLEGGDFFFSYATQLTLTLQQQAELYSAGANPLAWEHASPTFTWNREALAPIAAAAPGPWLTPLIHGSIHCEHLSPTTGVSITACLISRRSADHAGTRLKARGVDDAGFVANAVESEQAILFSAANRRATCALVQTRGSAPLFWEQRGSAVKVNPKPKLLRSVPLTVPAIRRHITRLKAAYGEPIVLISLLEHKGDEAGLASALGAAMGALASEPPARAKYAAIDIKALCKAGRAEGMRAAIGRLDADLAAISHLTIRGTGGDIGGTTGGLAVARRQVGVMRINCLDCLNRTNLLMSALALRAAAVQLRELAALAVGNVAGEHLSRASEPSLLAALQRMWGEVGDAISIQYAGTANLGKAIPEAGKRSLVERSRGFVEKGRIAVNRYVQETFLEDGRQAAIESLLTSGASAAACSVSKSARSGGEFKLWVGTWNSNGKAVSEEDLERWFRSVGDTDEPPHVYAIGFQEFVDLSARNMLTDDGSRRRECCMRVEAALARVHAVGYAPVCAEQCVGVLLLVYVSQSIVGGLTHVRADVVKCGFGYGETRAGNKGGTAVRLSVNGSSLCLINAHLPAGASHADERNDTYGEILGGLAKAYTERMRGGPFPPPLAHDLCIFFGDLNYRIEAPNDAVRAAVAAGRWAQLLTADQLSLQQRAGGAFVGFSEAHISFPPTYKYDAGTSNFDSSEKQRVPSYCDRVLWRQLRAGSAECAPLAYVSCMDVLTSDHKPVAALLRWTPPAVADGAVGRTAAMAPAVGVPSDGGNVRPAEGATSGICTAPPPSYGGSTSVVEASLIDFEDLGSDSQLTSPEVLPPPLSAAPSTEGERGSADLAAGVDLAGLLSGCSFGAAGGARPVSATPPPPPPPPSFPVSFGEALTLSVDDARPSMCSSSSSSPPLPPPQQHHTYDHLQQPQMQQQQLLRQHHTQSTPSFPTTLRHPSTGDSPSTSVTLGAAAAPSATSLAPTSNAFSSAMSASIPASFPVDFSTAATWPPPPVAATGSFGSADGNPACLSPQQSTAPLSVPAGNPTAPPSVSAAPNDPFGDLLSL